MSHDQRRQPRRPQHALCERLIHVQQAPAAPYLWQWHEVCVDEVLQWCVNDVEQVVDPAVAGEQTANICQQGRQTVQPCKDTKSQQLVARSSRFL